MFYEWVIKLSAFLTNQLVVKHMADNDIREEEEAGITNAGAGQLEPETVVEEEPETLIPTMNEPMPTAYLWAGIILLIAFGAALTYYFSTKIEDHNTLAISAQTEEESEDATVNAVQVDVIETLPSSDNNYDSNTFHGNKNTPLPVSTSANNDLTVSGANTERTKEQKDFDRRLEDRKRASSYSGSENQSYDDDEEANDKVPSGDYLSSLQEMIDGNKQPQEITANTNNGSFGLPNTFTPRVDATLLKQRNYSLEEGDIISGTLDTAINSQLSGKVRAWTNYPVWSSNGGNLLIEKYSKLVGEYRNDVSTGTTRIFIIWTRLITPDGISVRLDSPSTDNLGRSGQTGTVNTHFISRFGASLLVSIIGGIAQGEATNNNQQQALTDSFNSSAEIALENSINIPPTINVHQGEQINIFVNNDINFFKALEQIEKVKSPSAKQLRNTRPTYTDYRFAKDLNSPPIRQQQAIKMATSESSEPIITRGNVNPHRLGEYNALAGSDLKTVLTNWSRQVDYDLIWQVTDDQDTPITYEIDTAIKINGNYFQAVTKLLNDLKIKGSDEKMSPDFYKNDILVVTN